MTAIGATMWALACGDIPPDGTGPEPEFTSHDRLCVLNTGAEPTRVEVTLYHEDHAPVGPYHLRIPARRVRHVRVNDLIDPQAPPLGQPYGCVVRAERPVVVQFLRQDTRQPANSVSALAALPLTPDGRLT